MASTEKYGLQRRLRPFGPAIPNGSPKEALRAGIGALFGLTVAALFILTPGVDLKLGLYMVAPFGASAVLVFAVPNSPLAQPWSAVVGNGISALIGVAVVLSVADPALRVGLAVGLAVLAMILVRAMHPPGGAVAMTAALSPEAIEVLGFRFALAPVVLGTVVLVALAMIYARLTGRHYPFRQSEEPNSHGTQDPPPLQRTGLSHEELVEILGRFRQSANVGVEDLSRLIAAAELQVAGHRVDGLTCADIMSRDLVTVGPREPLSRVADLFRQHNFTSLPVVENGDRFVGVIFQIHLIRRGRDDALRLNRGFASAMGRLLDRTRTAGPYAENIMAVGMPRLAPSAPISALIPLLASGDVEAVPILNQGRLVGIVTQTDLIAALARQPVAADDEPS